MTVSGLLALRRGQEPLKGDGVCLVYVWSVCLRLGSLSLCRTVTLWMTSLSWIELEFGSFVPSGLCFVWDCVSSGEFGLLLRLSLLFLGLFQFAFWTIYSVPLV